MRLQNRFKRRVMEKEDEIRKYLMDYFKSKNTAHLGYFLSLTFAFFTLLTSEKKDNLFNIVGINNMGMILIFSSWYIYFICRMIYWTAYSWAAMVVRPEKEIKFEDTDYKDNLFWRLQRACGKKVNSHKLLFVEQSEFSSRRFKIIFLFILPLLICLIFRFFNIPDLL